VSTDEEKACFNNWISKGLKRRIKAYGAQGKHSLAKNTFESFSKGYKAIYSEGFERDFHSILK
jgi:hypothetical protein